MATVTLPKRNGKDVTVFVNNIPIGCEDTCDIEATTSTLDTTTKCSKDSVTGILWGENQPNINSLKLTGSGLVPVQNSGGTATEFSAEQLALAQFSQQKVYVIWGQAGTNFQFGAYGWITTTKITAAYNDTVKYNWQIDVTGAPVIFPVS